MNHATLALASVAFVAASLPAKAATTIPVPSDPKARYTLIAKKPMKNGHLEVTTRRVGPSGESYARREVDCRSMQFRYLAAGDTAQDIAVNGKNLGSMAPLVEGSISWHVARFSCR